jgi:hypothetical protein
MLSISESPVVEKTGRQEKDKFKKILFRIKTAADTVLSILDSVPKIHIHKSYLEQYFLRAKILI